MQRQYTQETFLQKARDVHGEKYDYSKAVFEKTSGKVTIICPIHGEFRQNVSNHFRGQGCPLCGKERRAEKQRNGGGCASKESVEKRRKTIMDRYGAKTWAESEDGRAKLKALGSDETLRKKISDAVKSKEARQKYKETSLKHFGAEHWLQSKEGREKWTELCNQEEERMARSMRMLSQDVQDKIKRTSMERYGTPYYWQSEDARVRLKELLNSEEVVEKTRQTNLERYGHETWQGSKEGRSKLASDEVRKKTEMTNLERYGAKTWSETEEGRFAMKHHLRDKIITTMRKNGTILRSAQEKDAYVMLVQKFGKEDVIPQYCCDRYPFTCDFYIQSLDLFIELNIYWMHGGHWFDENNEHDLEQLQAWLLSDKESYARAVYIWSQNDVEKRKTAIENNLNYHVFWNQDLSDFKEWLESI